MGSEAQLTARDL